MKLQENCGFIKKENKKKKTISPLISFISFFLSLVSLPDFLLFCFLFFGLFVWFKRF